MTNKCSEDSEEEKQSKSPSGEQLMSRMLTWLLCGKHGVRYPAGDECPMCQGETDDEE
jgi:hypothetical protein